MNTAKPWRVRRRKVASPVPGAARVVGLDGDHRCRGFRGTRTYDDGERRFSVSLRGAGSMAWSYEASTGELRIEGVRGTDGTTEIVVFRHRGEEFGLGDTRILRPIGALFCNAIFGVVTLRRQRGRFRFGDAAVEVDVDFPRETTVHYDGANGALEAAPADGSLFLDAVCSVEPTGAAVLEVRPAVPAAKVAWQQVRGPRLRVQGARSPRACIGTDALGEDDLAAFIVGMNLGRAVALDTVFVRPAGR